MIENKDKSGQPNKGEQLKRFPFFNVENIPEKVADVASHPVTFAQLKIRNIKAIYPKLYLLENEAANNSIYVYTNQIIGEWKPHTDSTFLMETSGRMEGAVLVTYGQDSEAQMKSTYIKLWEVSEVADYTKLKAKKVIIVGTLGNPELGLSCMFLLRDLTTLAVGTKKGVILIYESKNLLTNDYKQSLKPLQKKEIRNLKVSRRSGSEVDIYFTTEDAFFWLENLSEKRKISQQQIQAMDITEKGTVVCCAKNDRKAIVEYDLSRTLRTWQSEGQKLQIRCFKENYLVVLTIEKKNEKDSKGDKYNVQIFDTLNIYFAYHDSFNNVQFLAIGYDSVYLVIRNGKDERNLLRLTEKENAYKIETFFKKSYFNEAWRFAKNQNSDPSLLAEISRLHGDLLYTKSDFAGAIKQYTLTLGFIEPSYVIRRFLDVSQILYLIEYLEQIHAKKIARRQHTALLLNCYVKQQKIENLSNFLSESSVESDLFDIETAIKVCRELKHFDMALNLAEQKKQHEYYLKILIEDRNDYDKALQHIRLRVEMEEKEKFVLQFGQVLMKFSSKKLIELIQLLVKAHSVSIKMKQKDAVLSKDDRETLEALNFPEDNIEQLTTITFKKPDEFLRLFLVNNDDLENFLNFLLRVQKLPNEQVIYHRLFEFYLEKILQLKGAEQNEETTAKIADYQNKIMDNLSSDDRKCDKNHLLVLFKMYDFDQGIVFLCRNLNMRDDLLNFYISRKNDDEILDLCQKYGAEQVNLWIHALKYFAKPQNKRETLIPKILKYLEQINTLSPLLILSILSKNKNIEYKYVKDFFLNKLKQDKASINKDREIVAKKTKKANESRAQYRKLKTTAKVFQSSHCAQCLNSLSFPSVHFMCGHSFHENCLGGDRECIKQCGFEIRNIIERKGRFDQERNDNKKLFEKLEERRNNPFEVISEFMGKGLFPREYLKRA